MVSEKLNTQNMFYSEIFTVRKNRGPHSGSYQESVATLYNYNLEFTVLILTYFKLKDGTKALVTVDSITSDNLDCSSQS